MAGRPTRPNDADHFVGLGLYDPAAPHAAERLALLRRLVNLGATTDDFAAMGDRLPWNPGSSAGCQPRTVRSTPAGSSGSRVGVGLRQLASEVRVNATVRFQSSKTDHCGSAAVRRCSSV